MGFYRGGPVFMSALSGIDIALWDLKGEALRCETSKRLLLTAFKLESSTSQYTSSWVEKSETRSRSTPGLEAIVQGM